MKENCPIIIKTRAAVIRYSPLCVSVCVSIVTHTHAGLTSEVVHEAGLGRDDPLGTCLTEDGDVVLWPLTQ